MELRAAADIDKDSPAAHWGLARAFENLEQFNEALEELRKTVELAPDNLDAMYGLGLAMAADPNATPAKMGEARDMLKKFIAKAPDTHPKKPEATEAVGALDEAIKQATAKPDPDAAKRPARRKS